MLDFSNTRSCIWIGVDVGTTGVRAIAYQKDGLSLCSADEFYPLETPYPDWAEQNPEIIYKAIEKVVREVANTLIYKGKNVSGIAISTVMHSFAPANENRELLSNMITWADSRSVGIVNELKKDEALVKGFYERTCCPTHSCYPFLKILWVRKNYPDVFAKMRYIYSLKDYIFEKMTGEWVVDKSSASASGLYNAHKMDWDEEILNYAGITREQLPPVVSTTYQSKLTDSAAQRLNLPENLPVVIGATDGVLVNVGIGAIEDGQLSATIGTSGAIRMLTKTPKVDSLGRTWCYNLTDDMWVAGGAINNGGIIMRWLRDKVCHYSNHRLEDIDIDPYDLMTLKASKIPAGAEGLLLLPFFTGERAPYWNSELRGMFFGLSLNHSRSHMIRAGMEGVFFDSADARINHSYAIIRPAIEQGFKPDIISTDLTYASMFRNMCWGLPVVLSKWLNLGLSLEEVIQACTYNPAKIHHLGDGLGTLDVGAHGNVTIFKVINKEFHMKNRLNEDFIGQKLIVPQVTIINGKIIYRNVEFPF